MRALLLYLQKISYLTSADRTIDLNQLSQLVENIRYFWPSRLTVDWLFKNCGGYRGLTKFVAMFVSGEKLDNSTT